MYRSVSTLTRPVWRFKCSCSSPCKACLDGWACAAKSLRKPWRGSRCKLAVQREVTAASTCGLCKSCMQSFMTSAGRGRTHKAKAFNSIRELSESYLGLVNIMPSLHSLGSGTLGLHDTSLVQCKYQFISILYYLMKFCTYTQGGRMTAQNLQVPDHLQRHLVKITSQKDCVGSIWCLKSNKQASRVVSALLASARVVCWSK